MNWWKSFLGGVASIGRGMSTLNIFPPSLPPLKRIPRIRRILGRTDEEIMRADWESIGEDFRKAAEKYKEDQSKE